MQFWYELNIRYRQPLVSAYLNMFLFFACPAPLFFLVAHCNNLLFVAAGPPDLPTECRQATPSRTDSRRHAVCTRRVLCLQKKKKSQVVSQHARIIKAAHSFRVTLPFSSRLITEPDTRTEGSRAVPLAEKKAVELLRAGPARRF